MTEKPQHSPALKVGGVGGGMRISQPTHVTHKKEESPTAQTSTDEGLQENNSAEIVSTEDKEKLSVSPPKSQSNSKAFASNYHPPQPKHDKHAASHVKHIQQPQGKAFQ